MSRFFFFFFFFFSLKAQTSMKEDIKILYSKAQEKITVIGHNMMRKLGQGPQETLKGTRSFIFNCQNFDFSKLSIQKKSLPLASMASIHSPISLNSESLKGKIEVYPSIEGKGCDIVGHMPMHYYLAALLSKEVNKHWPKEALKAQAVLARTYALKKKQNDQGHYFHLENSEKHQVTGSLEDISEKTLESVLETQGEVLVLSKNLDELAFVFYSAHCGGQTLLPKDVWGGHVQGLKTVDCPFCLKVHHRSWHWQISLEEFKKFLYQKLGRQGFKKQIPYKVSNATQTKLRIEQQGKEFFLSKALARGYFGRNLIKSNNFRIKTQKQSIIEFSGNGLGHGVGACQTGMYQMALQGHSYEKILKHYFPLLTLKKIY